MNFKIGDKVKFLNEKGEGIISKIITKTTVGVTVEDGFEIPFAVSSLLLIQNNKITISEKKEEVSIPIVSKKITVTSEIKNKDGIYFAVSPEKINDISNSDFNFWLINYTNYNVLFGFSVFSKQKYRTLETGYCNAFEYLLLETVDRKKLSDFLNSKLDILFFNEKEHDAKLPLSKFIKLKSVKLYKENAFSENKFIPEKAMLINLSDLLLDEQKEKVDLTELLMQKKTTSASEKKSKQHTQNNAAYEMEIDLHIEELLDDYSNLSNVEIIRIQLSHFQNALDKAIVGHCRKLIVIHGVGNGKLKTEVRNLLLENNQPNFYDASLAKYGFGATEILIGY